MGRPMTRSRRSSRYLGTITTTQLDRAAAIEELRERPPFRTLEELFERAEALIDILTSPTPDRHLHAVTDEPS